MNDTIMGEAGADDNDRYYFESYASQKIYIHSFRSLYGNDPPLIGSQISKIRFPECVHPILYEELGQGNLLQKPEDACYYTGDEAIFGRDIS